MAQGKKHLGANNEHGVLRYHAARDGTEGVKEVAPRNVVEHKVQLRMALEGVVETNDERVVHGLQNLLFRHDALEALLVKWQR
jgi:hypothetical protein